MLKGDMFFFFIKCACWMHMHRLLVGIQLGVTCGTSMTIFGVCGGMGVGLGERERSCNVWVPHTRGHGMIGLGVPKLVGHDLLKPMCCV